MCWLRVAEPARETEWRGEVNASTAAGAASSAASIVTAFMVAGSDINLNPHSILERVCSGRYDGTSALKLRTHEPKEQAGALRQGRLRTDLLPHHED